MVELELRHGPVLEHAALDDDEEQVPLVALKDDVEPDERAEPKPENSLLHRVTSETATATAAAP
ncbi:MAG TPA: hypothetical protein VK510_03105 [Solirubrobacteraceae bacterium]|nr:hypothetical protein [Solirubrobacteraceae bacterium]